MKKKTNLIYEREGILYADPILIQRALSNVLTNAIERYARRWHLFILEQK